MLFDGRRRIGLCQQLHIGGHHHRLDAVEPLAVSLAPVGEPETGNQIRLPRVRVADRGSEELPEALFGFRGLGEQGWSGAGDDARRDGVSGGNQGEIGHGGLADGVVLQR